MSIVFLFTVLLPCIVQAIYNLCFTHPGAQLFWEDIQSLAIAVVLMFLIIWDSCSKTAKIQEDTDTDKKATNYNSTERELG